MKRKQIFYPQDSRFMRIALRLAEEGKGKTEPNPLVGAVVVKSGRIISVGYHARYGGKHAECLALEEVSERRTTLYVSLEPCCHYGKTPPCTELLLEKDVRRVVIALRDPNPLVNGKGIEVLEKNGIEVSCGLMGEWAADINRHYLSFLSRKRPYVAIHAGVSLDGKLTDIQGNSRWITSERLRRISHSLRGDFSAIMAGRKTVEADDPLLTVPGRSARGKQMVRVVLDSQNRLSPKLRVFQDDDRFPLIVFSAEDAPCREKKSAYHFFVRREGGKLSLPEICATLASMGISSLLVEGGAELIDSFIAAGWVDEFFLFVSPRILGGKTSAQIYSRGATLAQAIGLTRVRLTPLDDGYIMQGQVSCSPES